jgi:hypothetical protein
MFPEKKKNGNRKWDVTGYVSKDISKWSFSIESKRGLGEAMILSQTFRRDQSNRWEVEKREVKVCWSFLF